MFHLTARRTARHSRLLAFAVAILAGMTLAPGAEAQAPGVTDTEIRIGSFGTLVGPTYLYGKMPMNGVDAVFAKVNEAGGIHGRKLTLIREDDRCDPATAITAVKRLIHSHRVFAIIGGGCSNAGLAAKPEIERSGIPFNVFASVADPISHPPVQNIFSTQLTASMESRAQLALAVQERAQRIAVVAQHDAWGRTRYEPLMAALKERGIKPVVDEEMTVDTNDATPQALRIQRANADAVLMVVYAKPGALLARALHRLGHKPLLIGQTAIADPVAFVEQVGVPGATDRFVTISPVRYSPHAAEVAPWRERIEKMFPGDRLSVFNLFGVGAAQVMVEALQRAGRDLTWDSYNQAMGSIKGFETDVYPGQITCEFMKNHQCHRTPAWIREKGGDVEVIAVTPVN
jgi:branched-chain amino acid transport system substrate-binding protein